MSDLEMLTTALAELQAENARLERRVDELLRANAAQIVRGSDPTLPDVAVEREEIEGA